MKRTIAIAIVLLLIIAVTTEAQKKRSTLEGMWSDPPVTTVGTLCASICSDVLINKLNALLDDPANDARPFQQLQMAARKTEEEYIHARLTPAALEKYPVNPVEDALTILIGRMGLSGKDELYVPVRSVEQSSEPVEVVENQL